MPTFRDERRRPATDDQRPVRARGNRRTTQDQANVTADRSSVVGRRSPGSSFAARFGRVILQDGIATIPSALLHYQGALALSAQQVWFVSYILAHKWDEDLPYPSLKAMSRRVGMSISQVQRIKNSLCEMGMLKVYPRWTEAQGQGTNSYDFSDLFDKLEELIIRDAPTPNAIRAEDENPPDMAELGEVDPSFVARYGRVITKRGVAAVPRAVFTHQAQLRITPQQVWFITYIFSFQWATALPYPSLRKMSTLTGYSSVQLHTIKGELVTKGYLRLVHRSNGQGGQDTNAYDFSGLLDAIRGLLQPDNKEREVLQDKPEVADVQVNPVRRRGRKSTTASSVGGSSDLTGGDSIEFTRGDSTEFSIGDRIQLIEGGSAQFSDGDRTELRGGDSTELSIRGRNGLTEEGSAHLPRAIKRAHAGGASVRYQGGVARGLHKIESVQEESNQKRVDSNQPHLIAKMSETETSTTPPPYSPYIASVISDFSNDLNDPSHIISNVTQALRLWSATGLGEQPFTDLLYEAKRITRTYQGKNGLQGIDNKMAYFFRVLRDLCSTRSQD